VILPESTGFPIRELPFWRESTLGGKLAAALLVFDPRLVVQPSLGVLVAVVFEKRVGG
jgi:hypothetical protein